MTIVMRYGIQMVTHIDDTGIRKIKFSEPKIAKEEGVKTLQIDIENTGERWVRPKVWIELFTLEGTSAGTVEGPKSRIYPGTSVRIKFDLSKIIAGTYKTLVVADCGDEDLFGANYTLKIKD